MENKHSFDNVRCRSCGSTEVRRLFHLPHVGPIYVCQCGLRFVGTVFNDEQQRSFYSHDDYVEFARAMQKSGRQLRARTVAEIASRCSPERFRQERGRVPRLLDVGCGAGDLLAAARERGFQVRGVEVSTNAANLAKEWHDIDVDLTPLAKYSEQFDVVTSLGVLEHVTDPAELLQSMARVTAPGGMLLIYTPGWGLYDNLTTFLARSTSISRFIGRRINRSHLQIFSSEALSSAVKRVGLRIVSVRRLCEYNLDPELYFESLHFPKLLSRVAGFVAQWFIRRGLFFRNNMELVAVRD